MARRGRESALKRAREKARQDKQAEKRARRHARTDDEQTASKSQETALMEEFAELSESHESGQITTDDYETERHRIFVELGLEEPKD